MDPKVIDANMETVLQPTSSNKKDESKELPAQKRMKKTDDSQRIKKKLGDGVTYEDLVKDWTQCCYLVHHKQRLCNMARGPNSRYCGNHAFLTEEAKKNKTDEADHNDAVSDERVPCPLDPSHTVFLHHLEMHLKKCNAKKYQDEVRSLPYYRHNCNGGEVTTSNNDTHNNHNCEVQKIDLDALVAKVHRVFERVELHPLIDIEESELQNQIDDSIRTTLGKEQTSFKQTRHTEQDIAIVHQLIRNDLLTSDNYLAGQPNAAEQNSTPNGGNRNLFIEFGAGKGLLGLAVHVCDPQAYLVFIERSSNRKKVDKTLNEKGFRLFERVRMDIRHCYVPCLPCVKSPVEDATKPKLSTIIAKHLCGLASDLAIRSLSHYSSTSLSRRRGVGIATCCHHACSYVDYVGHQWLREQDITVGEFNILRCWSGWATVERTAEYRRPKESGKNEAVECDQVEQEHAAPAVGESMRPKGLNHDEMADIGRKVKRIFDFGRIKYLREELNMDAKLVYYCDSKLSPECVMILAKDK